MQILILEFLLNLSGSKTTCRNANKTTRLNPLNLAILQNTSQNNVVITISRRVEHISKNDSRKSCKPNHIEKSKNNGIFLNWFLLRNYDTIFSKKKITQHYERRSGCWRLGHFLFIFDIVAWCFLTQNVFQTNMNPVVNFFFTLQFFPPNERH